MYNPQRDTTIHNTIRLIYLLILSSKYFWLSSCCFCISSIFFCINSTYTQSPHYHLPVVSLVLVPCLLPICTACFHPVFLVVFSCLHRVYPALTSCLFRKCALRCRSHISCDRPPQSYARACVGVKPVGDPCLSCLIEACRSLNCILGVTARNALFISRKLNFCPFQVFRFYLLSPSLVFPVFPSFVVSNWVRAPC